MPYGRKVTSSIIRLVISIMTRVCREIQVLGFFLGNAVERWLSCMRLKWGTKKRMLLLLTVQARELAVYTGSCFVFMRLEKVKKHIETTRSGALVYQLWTARNWTLYKNHVIDRETIFQQMKSKKE
ncbi:uncharacterized protein LOC124887004 [Capsicum annuum]|uniref:uncharacterized protein LOC124887004 n=1 Tax=Capsicum annuum TaxID=4072 RepID=UPI001FB056C9|nr:uncharacterized protein LOC124887004 [Capsicum annuum]